jgi:hypothetical protein
VSEQTIEALPTDAAPRPGSGPPRPRPPMLARLREHPWAILAVALVLFSYAFARWARTSPGYDPYGWLNWGYQTWHLSLDLGGAPSWKPLTYVFTVPFSLFGHYAFWLWIVASISIALSGSIFAGRIAYRLTGGFEAESRSERLPAIVAAAFAAVAVLGIQTYLHMILSVQSDPMIVSMVLAAIDCHLSGHQRWTFALGVLGSLGRPECWPFIGLYSIWAWRAIPSMRKMIVIGLLVIPVVWFGIPTITNGRPLLAGDLAERSPRELHENKILGTFHRFTGLTYLPIQLAALAATIWAWFRRDRVVLTLAAGIVGWLVIETAFVLHGWPGVPRYMFETAGVLTVLAAVFVGWVLTEALKVRGGAVRWAGIALVGVIVVAMVPGALARIRDERTDLTHERARTKVIGQLHAAISNLGGAEKIKYCGEPVTNVEYVSVLAYYAHLNDGNVGHRPKFELKLKHPIVLFTQIPNGWAITPHHTAPGKVATCASLKKLWIYTQRHPGGELVPNRG